MRPVFEHRIIIRRAVKDKCYADNPETIDALRDNIREAIGEIQLHTIGYCLVSRGSHLNEINFHY